jgi:hypothetical protein
MTMIDNWERAKFVAEYRRMKGCADCGTFYGQLTFHHLDPLTKICEVGECSSWESLNAEVAKCIVLCWCAIVREKEQMKRKEKQQTTLYSSYWIKSKKAPSFLEEPSVFSFSSQSSSPHMET